MFVDEKQKLLDYFSRKKRPTREENDLLQLMEREIKWFDICRVNRDELTESGYDGDQKDGRMLKLVLWMDDYIQNNGYWKAALDFAAEKCKIEKLKKD